MDVLLSKTEDSVATLTLNRPEKRNALSSELLSRLRAELERLDEDDAVAAIILTGADPAFSAGLDLEELGSTGDNMINADAATGHGPIPPLRKPLIAAVNGPAVTGGLEIVALCDIVIASEKARFADTHARIGLLPDWGLVGLLPQAIGIRKATEMLLASTFLDADEACRCGLVNRVVPHDALLDAATEVALEIAAGDRPATLELLSLLKEVRGKTVEEGIAIEARRSLAWQGAGVDSSAIAGQRSAVIDRGSSKI